MTKEKELKELAAELCYVANNSYHYKLIRRYNNVL